MLVSVWYTRLLLNKISSLQAVCCSDQEHCCPKGYKCNVAQQTCDKPGGLTLPWLLKVPALQREPTRAVSLPAQLARKMCDSNTSCPKDTTCCFMEQTQKWGCCPLPTVRPGLQHVYPRKTNRTTLTYVPLFCHSGCLLQ